MGVAGTSNFQSCSAGMFGLSPRHMVSGFWFGQPLARIFRVSPSIVSTYLAEPPQELQASLTDDVHVPSRRSVAARVQSW